MRVGERGQVTIPKEIRDRFGLGANSEVEFHVENGSIVLKKAPKTAEPGEVEGAVCGELPGTRDFDDG